MSRWKGLGAGLVGLVGPVAVATGAVGCSANVVSTADATSSTTIAFVTFERSVSAVERSAPAEPRAATSPQTTATTPSVAASAQAGQSGQTDAAPQPSPSGADAAAAAAPTDAAPPTPPVTTPSAATPAGLSAAAVFLRLSAGSNERIAAHLVGVDLFLPDLGTCAPIEVLRDNGLPLASVNPIDLVDVGEVTVETDSTKATLAARVFPDVADLISGVFYTTRTGSGVSPVARGSYRLRATGSSTFPSTALQATAPADFEWLLLNEQPIQSDPLVLGRADVRLQWSANQADIVYVNLSSSASEDGVAERVRCTFPDEGHGTIPVSVLPRSANQRISVHRLHTEAVQEPGVDGGEIRFNQALTANLRFETQ